MNGRKGRTAALAAVALVVGMGPFLGASGAWASACAAPARYALSSNTLYVIAGVTTLSQLKAACPGAPFQESSPGSGVWELDGDLVVQNGARLDLHGTSQGGDVDVLRLRSASSGLKTEVSAVTAQYGTLDLLNVTVTSWDPATGAPDTDPSVPAGAPADARGRAFIRALSYLDPDGVTPHESRMDIKSSDLGYLGSNAAESQGVAYKARGCGVTTQAVCDQVGVLGSEVDSKFHNNFMGTYTWGADAIAFTGNEYHHNIDYGLDPHDDSDGLLIDHNSSHDNGNHGIICSQRCDHLTISNNTVFNNGVIPYIGPGDDDPTDNQVHGIMIHRGVTDTVIENNNVYNNPNGAGIAVFDSSNDVIRNNTLTKNKYGVRFSVGARNVTVTGNTITTTGTYGIYAYKGTDIPTYTNTSGRSSDIVVSGNTVTGSGSDIVKVGDADRYTFSGNTIGGTIGGDVRMERSSDMRWVGNNTVPSNEPFVVRGISTSRGSARFQNLTKPLTVVLDQFSSASAESADGHLARVSAGVYSAVTTTGSALALTSGIVGTGAVLVSPQPVRLAPVSGTLSALPSLWSAAGGQLTVKAATKTQRVDFVVDSVAPGKAVIVKTSDGKIVASGVAASNGEFRFSNTPGRTTAWTYTVGIS